MQLVKDKSNAVSEDEGKHGKDDIEAMTKKHVSKIDEMCETKSTEIQAI